MYSRLLHYLETSDNPDNQFGFCKAHFTYMVLLKLMNEISNELDNKKYSVGIFIDLSNAFDNTDHTLLSQQK